MFRPRTHTIAKDSSINDEIDKLRLSATMALTERRDVIIVASVSCIYGLGSPVDYQNMVISLRPGMTKDRDEVMAKLIEIQYDRNDMDFTAELSVFAAMWWRSYRRMRANVAIRIEFSEMKLKRINGIEYFDRRGQRRNCHNVAIFPASTLCGG